jgi:L-threonylcarbamoyladenylate synthase
MTKVSQTELIAGVLRGKVISFPTDTVPALAALPVNSQLIFATKKRPQTKPLILMGATAQDLWKYIKGTALELEMWEKVAQKYWPGQLTLVLPASSLVPPTINPTEPSTIGLRIPNSSVAREILRETGALATTSANLSGEQPLETLREIERVFPEVLTLDCGEFDRKLGNGVPSTVARWTGEGWEILRQGSIREIIV